MKLLISGFGIILLSFVAMTHYAYANDNINNIAPSIAEIQQLGDLLKIAEQGEEHAQFMVGMKYFKGETVSRNYKKALYWCTESAKQGNAKAQRQLGEMYDLGIGVPQNDKKALYWYTKAAKQGDDGAQMLLGQMYGVSTPKEYEQSIYWYTKSAEQGNWPAQASLGILLHIGKGFTHDYRYAYAWSSIALEANPFDTRSSKNRDALVKKFSPQELIEAQELASEIQHKIDHPEPMIYDEGWKTLTETELAERIQRPVLNINTGEPFNFKVINKNDKEVGIVNTPAEYYSHRHKGNRLFTQTTYDQIDRGLFRGVAMPLLYLSKAKLSKQSYVNNFPFDNEDPLFVLPVDFISWRGSGQREVLEKASAKNRPWRYVSPNARVIKSTSSDLKIYDTFAEDLYSLPKNERYTGDQASHSINPVVLGDLNNDGYEDIVLNCAHYNVEGSGRSYYFVVLTRTSPNDILKDITEEVDKLIWKEPIGLDSNTATIKDNAINRSLKASNAELSPRQIEIIQTVLNPDGYISKKLHSEFWDLMPVEVRDDKQVRNDIVNFMDKNFLLSIQFTREGFASMKASIKAGRVVKTPGYESAKNKFNTSVPLQARQKIQKSIDNSEGMITAAAEAKPFQSNRGIIYITLEMVNQMIAGLDDSFSRASRLMNPEWGQEIKGHKSDVLPTTDLDALRKKIDALPVREYEDKDANTNFNVVNNTGIKTVDGRAVGWSPSAIREQSAALRAIEEQQRKELDERKTSILLISILCIASVIALILVWRLIVWVFKAVNRLSDKATTSGLFAFDRKAAMMTALESCQEYHKKMGLGQELTDEQINTLKHTSLFKDTANRYKREGLSRWGGLAWLSARFTSMVLDSIDKKENVRPTVYDLADKLIGVSLAIAVSTQNLNLKKADMNAIKLATGIASDWLDRNPNIKSFEKAGLI